MSTVINPLAVSLQQLNTQPVNTTGSPYTLTITGGAHTTLTAATEATDINFNLARTVQFATGALTTQRAFRIQAPTYGFVGASTLTAATTFEVGGAPLKGTNATFTFARAMNITGTAHNASSGYGLTIEGNSIANGAGAITSIIDLIVGGSFSNVSLGNETSTLTNLYKVLIDTDSYTSTTLTRTVTSAGGLFVSPPTVATGVTLVTMQNVASITVEQGSEYPSLAAFNYAGVHSLSGTIIVSGTTTVSGTVGVAGMKIGIITIDNTSAGLTVNAAASLYIEGAVAQSGNATITNSMAVWVDAGTVRIDGQQRSGITTDAAATVTITSTDDIYILHSTRSSAGTQTVNLPAAVANTGRILQIKDAAGSAGANNITIIGNAAETIDGAATVLINTNYGSRSIYCNGTVWFTF